MRHVEIDYRANFECPFCAKVVLDWEALEAGEQGATPCLHTLLVGHDAGVDFRSPLLDAAWRKAGMELDDTEPPEDGFEALFDRHSFQEVVAMSSYVPAPSFFGTYAFFARLD